MKYNELLTLGKIVANANPSAPIAYSWGEDKFTYENLNETFAKELNEMYKENPKTAFALMEEVINDVLPKKVMAQYGQFAEVKTFGQGDKPVFTQRITENSKRRAKQFVTKVGLAGHYEVFKLDGKSYEVQTSAYGGAAQIGFEEFLDGRITMADVLDLVIEAMDEKIYAEIERALIGAIKQLGTANKTHQTTFNEIEFDKLLTVADSYGTGKATIYCTFDFAAQMIPTDARFGGAGNLLLSDGMKDTLWNNGYLGNYKGHRIIILEQSFVDEQNVEKVIEPSLAWIIPGTADKPVKVAFEGTTHIREVENEDWSKSVHMYQKVGVAATITNDICVYQNTSLNTEVNFIDNGPANSNHADGE